MSSLYEGVSLEKGLARLGNESGNASFDVFYDTLAKNTDPTA